MKIICEHHSLISMCNNNLSIMQLLETAKTNNNPEREASAFYEEQRSDVAIEKNS